jgi:hypothetical protein
MEAPQNKRFYGKMECLPLWPTYVGDKTYAIRARCYWEHPGGTRWEPKKYIENLMGTHQELEGNMLGTKEIFFKSHTPSPPLSPNYKLGVLILY